LTQKFKLDNLINGDQREPFRIDEHVTLEKGAGDMSDKNYEEGYLADAIRFKMRRDNKRFWAGDNVSDYVTEDIKHKLIDEATEAFELVLDRLLIDRDTDPNSKGTARRLAKMYFNEIMAGRYEPAPDATAFPNDSADLCVAIITNPLVALLILALLLPRNLSASASTPVSPSGALDVELSRRNLLMILLGKSKKPPEQKT